MDASEIPEEQIPTSSSIIANGTVSAERVRRILALLGGHQNDDQDRWWWRELLHDVAFQFPLAATIREDSYSMDAGDQPIGEWIFSCRFYQPLSVLQKHTFIRKKGQTKSV
jgi:hypothetical protein